MRVLVAAPFPPAPDEAAGVALATVQRLLGEGHAVEVISPLPSAAEHHGPLAGLGGALLLARRARHYDALHLVVSRRILFAPERPLARRVLDSAALAWALRRWRYTSADLGDLSDVPGGGGGVSGRLVWASVGEIFVSQEPVRNHAVKVLGFPADRVKVASPAGVPPGPAGGAETSTGAPWAHATPAGPREPWKVAAPADWAAVTAEIRARAAAERSRLEGPGQA